MYPFLVNYTASQARFIEKLAQHMDKSASEVVASIITTAREILDTAGSAAREDFLDELVEEPRSPGATYRQETLALPDEEYDYVTALAKEAGASHSCVVRHVVAFFLDSVEDAGDKNGKKKGDKASDVPEAEDG